MKLDYKISHIKYNKIVYFKIKLLLNNKTKKNT